MVGSFPILLIEWLRQEYDVIDMWVVEGMVELHLRATERQWRIVFVLVGKPHHIEISGYDPLTHEMDRESLDIDDNSVIAYGKTFLVGDPDFFDKIGKILTSVGIKPHVPGTDKPKCAIHTVNTHE